MKPIAEHPRFSEAPGLTGGVLVSLATVIWWSVALAQGPKPVFECWLGAKTVSVVRDGGDWVYRFGRPGKIELTIVGNLKTNNIFYGVNRYYALEHQIRFTKGQYSYVVFSLPPDSNVGARGASGLTVLKDMKTIARMSCVRWTDLDTGYDLSRVRSEHAGRFPICSACCLIHHIG